MDEDARSGKRDRLARITRVVSLLRAHPDGMAIKDMAKRIDVSVRTVYRDLNAIEGEIGIGVWSEGGRWGLAADEFLPPLKLTQDEAMAVVLSARLMVRYADKYDPDLASAFEKLGEVLPPALGEHVARTLDVLSRHPRDERFSRHVNLLTKAWAERRIVSLDYEPGSYGLDPPCRQALRDLLPKDRRNLVTEEPIDDPSGFLGIDQSLVQLTWRLDGGSDRILGDLMKDHALDRNFWLQYFEQVPRNTFSFTVFVACQPSFERCHVLRLSQLDNPMR